MEMFWGLAVKDQIEPDRYIQNDSECGLRPFSTGLMLETLPVGWEGSVQRFLWSRLG